VRRKNLRRIDMPPAFSNEGGRLVCSNAWVVALMRREARLTSHHESVRLRVDKQAAGGYER